MSKEKAMTKKVSDITGGNMVVPEGYEINIAREDVRIPSVLLYQKMSDMAEFEGENVQAGTFVNPVTGEILGESFEAVVINYYATARLYGEKDVKTGRKEVKRFSRDGVHWDDTGDKIAPNEFAWREDGAYAVKSYHYLIQVKDSSIPSMITFKGASAKYAKGLNANLMWMKPSWKSYFKFSSASEEKNGNKYHVINAKAQPREFTDEDTYNGCTELWKSMKNQTIVSPEMEKENEFDGDAVKFD